MAEHLLCLPLKHKHKDLKDIGPDDHHREWGWADEWGWVRSVHIPYSISPNYPTDHKGWVSRGKVLEKAGSGWDSYLVNQPCVLKIGGTYRLYYTGLDGTPWTTHCRIGLATSLDGLNFTRYGVNGKIVDPETGYTAVLSPCVIYDVYETNSSKKYKMIANAWKTATSAYEALYYYSADGISWTFDSELSGLGRPNVLFRIGNAYFIYYKDEATYEIKLKVTRDFLTWYDGGTVIPKGAAGEWDDEGYGWNSLFWNLGVWYMFLQGSGDAPSGYPTHPWKIGMALSSDGFTWTKYLMNPIQEPDNGTWYDNSLIQPTVLMVENMFWLYCCGRDSSNAFSIGRFDIESS